MLGEDISIDAQGIHDKQSYSDPALLAQFNDESRIGLEHILQYDIRLYKQLAGDSNDGPMPQGPIFAFIMFPRVGSRTLYKALGKRAQRHGWHAERAETDLVRGFDAENPLCHWPKMRDDPQSQNLECSRQPDGAVVTANYPGFCEALGGARPCHSFTLLREPIARMVSDYTHFCLNCASSAMCEMPENERRYAREHPNAQLPPMCPNMSLLEYAFRHANPYTRRFSRVEGHELAVGELYSPGHEHFVKEEHYQSALETLTSKDMTVLWVEDFEQGGLSRLSSLLGDNIYEDAHEFHDESSDWSLQLHADESSKLQRILAYDIRLYNALLERTVTGIEP